MRFCEGTRFFNVSSLGIYTATVLIACTKTPPTTTSQVRASVYVKAIYSIPKTLDPVRMNDTVSLVVGNLIYDGLLRFSNDLQFEGAIAESWVTEDDGRRYVFKIRQDAKFHNGDPITARDVVNSLSRAVAPGSLVYKYYDCIVGAESYFQGKVSSVKGLKEKDPHTISIDLKYPFPPFLSVLAGATAKVLPANVDSQKSFFEKPIGSGPFQMDSIKRLEDERGEIHLSRFEQYGERKPKIERMILRSLSETEAQDQARQQLVFDLANFPLSGNEPVFNMGKDESSPVAATWVIGINTRKAPFDRLNVRRAFKAAVDTEGFRSTFYPDAVPAGGYIPKGLPGFREKNGQKDFVDSVAPKHTAIRIAFPELLSREKEMRSHLENNLKRQGWNVKFVPMSWDKLMDGYDKKALQGFVVSMNMDYPDTEFLIRNFESNNPDNFSGLKDAELDKSIRKARSVQDRIARAGLYREIVDQVENLSVTVNLFHPRAHNWVHQCVKNFVPSILADYYIDYRNVELSEECLQRSRL